MNVVKVEYCVEDALRRGLRGEAVFASVMARVNRPGARAEWGRPPITDPFWMEQMTREANGRKSSKRQIEAASNRYIISCWEEHLLAKLKAEALDPQVLVEGGAASYVPCGTLAALDGGRGWDVTLASRVRRKPLEKILWDLEPLLRSLAKRARRAFSLEEAYEDDLKQLARIKLARKVASFEGRCELETWAYRVAWRAMVDEGRRLRDERKREQVGLDSWDGEAPEVFDAVDDRLALRTILLDAFEAVQDAELVFLQELGFQDFEISDANIRMKRSRARVNLRETLHDEPEVMHSLAYRIKEAGLDEPSSNQLAVGA